MMKLSVVLGTILALGIAQHASAAPIIWTAAMNGPNEVPSNASPATGFTTLTLNGDMLTVDVTFNGLIGGNSSAAHIHCCVAPPGTVAVALPYTAFPSGASGTYSHVFDLTMLSVYTSGFVTNFGGGTAAGAEAALIAAFNNGTAYSNIHNGGFPNGEIRGFLAPVPEPVTLSLFGAGLTGAIAIRRRRKKSD